MAKNKDAKEKAEPTYVFNVVEQPTVKQQITSSAVQLGIALAVPAAGFVALSAVGAVATMRDKIKARKAAKATPEAVAETPDTKE